MSEKGGYPVNGGGSLRKGEEANPGENYGGSNSDLNW